MNNQKRCNICDILLDNDSTHNKSIGVNIDGEDQEQAMNSIEELFQNGFDEGL